MIFILKYDASTDPLTGIIFVIIFLAVFVVLGLIGDKTGDYSPMEKWSKNVPSERTGNRTKAAARRKRRRKLEEKYNLGYGSLSHHSDEDMDKIEPRRSSSPPVTNIEHKRLSDKEVEGLNKEIEVLENRITDIYSFVEKHYDKSKNLISIEPKDYGFYDEIIDPVEKTEVMVIEYLQNLKNKQRNYKFEWSYQGLIDGLCVYEITKTSKYNENQNFNIDDINSAFLENECIIEEPYLDEKLNVIVIPYLVPIDNLGFSRDLNKTETNQVIKDFCNKGDLINCEINNIKKVKRYGVNYHRYLLSKKDVLNEKRSRTISQSVKDKVWNRDGGKCVECGSNENLEFDHIIPHSKGGANTYRNIQLLCEPCNRSKSAKIG